MSNRKKTDEKQDKVIEQLQKNRRAITNEFEDLVMLQQLPEQAQAEQTSKLPIDYKPVMTGKIPKLQSNLDDGFTPDEIQTLMKYELFALSDVLMAVKDKKLDWHYYDDKIGKLLKQIGSEKGRLSKNHKMKAKNAEEINELTNNIKTIQKYRERIGLIPEGLKTVGKGIYTQPIGKRIYTQPKRNAYKIQDGNYGGLMIDLPKLLNEMKWWEISVSI